MGRALLGPQASSPAQLATRKPELKPWQARTPAVPEEVTQTFKGVTKG